MGVESCGESFWAPLANPNYLGFYLGSLFRALERILLTEGCLKRWGTPLPKAQRAQNFPTSYFKNAPYRAWWSLGLKGSLWFAGAYTEMNVGLLVVVYSNGMPL